MKRRQPARAFSLAALVAAFGAGVLVDGLLRTYGPPQPVDAPAMIAPAGPSVRAKPDAAGAGVMPDPTGTAATAKPNATDTSAGDGSAAASGSRSTSSTGQLRLPIDGMSLDALKGGFYEPRGGHRHEAIDILAPRNTPVHAVDAGSVARLFLSKQGGITVYQYDPSGRYCYYYAHLERYAEHLREGDPVAQGQLLGYVGTTGNAPPNTPHLHFAVFELDELRSWWKGRAIDPYPVLKGRATG